MKIITTKDLLKQLANLDKEKETWVVCEEWVYVSTNKPCKLCEGKGNFLHGNNTYSCLDCNGTGKAGEKKQMCVVRRAAYAGNYPELTLTHNEIEMPFFYYIKGFFNDRDKAQALADKLNKGI